MEKVVVTRSSRWVDSLLLLAHIIFVAFPAGVLLSVLAGLSDGLTILVVACAFTMFASALTVGVVVASSKAVCPRRVAARIETMEPVVWPDVVRNTRKVLGKQIARSTQQPGSLRIRTRVRRWSWGEVVYLRWREGETGIVVASRSLLPTNVLNENANEDNVAKVSDIFVSLTP